MNRPDLIQVKFGYLRVFKLIWTVTTERSFDCLCEGKKDREERE